MGAGMRKGEKGMKGRKGADTFFLMEKTWIQFDFLG